MACGDVHDLDSLIAYLEVSVALNLRRLELPYLRFSYEALERGDWETVAELDEEFNASKASKELRTASAAQGQQRLQLLAKLRSTDLLVHLAEMRDAKRVIPHHIVVFAAEYVSNAIPLDAALSAWAYQSFAAPCAASLKLFRIGQEGAQTALTKALDSIGTIVSNSLSVEREFAGSFNPVLDIASHRHQHAYARLFIS